jgi:hypothetical protein
MVIASLFVLAYVLAVEATTPLARIAGFRNGNPYSGLSLESTLSVLSRAGMFIFTPVFGILADRNGFSTKTDVIIIGTSLIPVFIILVRLFESQILKLYSSACAGLLRDGTLWSLFGRGNQNINIIEAIEYRSKTSNVQKTRFKWIQVLVFSVYVPYYLVWPVSMLLIARYHDHRATILSACTLFTSFSTLALVLYIDPKMVRLTRCPRISQVIYHRFVTSRIFSAFAALLILSCLAAGLRT